MSTSLKDNKRLRKRSINRFGKIKEQYVGTGFQKSDKNELAQLTPKQLAEGRHRAERYLRNRKIRITTEIIVGIVLSLLILYALFALFSYLLTSGLFDR